MTNAVIELFLGMFGIWYNLVETAFMSCTSTFREDWACDASSPKASTIAGLCKDFNNQ